MLAFHVGKAFSCLPGLNRNFLSPTTALASQPLNEWGLGAAGGAPAEPCQETAQHLPRCGTCYLCSLGKEKKKKKDLPSGGGKKRCFLTKTAVEFGRAACSLYKQIPSCASITLQCPWLLSLQVLEGNLTCRHAALP